jgi:hypothetical protein
MGQRREPFFGGWKKKVKFLKKQKGGAEKHELWMLIDFEPGSTDVLWIPQRKKKGGAKKERNLTTTV